MNKVTVYDHGRSLIGYGNVIFYNGHVLGPNLVDIAGKVLPPGWYHLVNDEPFLVIYSETIQ